MILWSYGSSPACCFRDFETGGERRFLEEFHGFEIGGFGHPGEGEVEMTDWGVGSLVSEKNGGRLAGLGRRRTFEMATTEEDHFGDVGGFLTCE